MDHDATVFVVDDDPAVRMLLALEMEAEGYRMAQYASAEDFLAGYVDEGCGCILLDMKLTGMSGLELLETLRSKRVAIPVIMITAYGDISSAVQSMKFGAVDFVQKPLDHDELLQKVSAAVSADKKRRQRQAEAELIRERLAKLTDRERELLKAVVAGKSSKAIAAELSISLKTVENHRMNMLSKAGAQNVAELVRLAMIAGIA